MSGTHAIALTDPELARVRIRRLPSSGSLASRRAVAVAACKHVFGATGEDWTYGRNHRGGTTPKTSTIFSCRICYPSPTHHFLH